MYASITGIAYHPIQRLEKMIPANFDIRGDFINECWPSPPKHDVLSRRLQLVVHDLEGPRTIPTRDSLRILAHNVDVGNIRINKRKGRSVEHNPVLHIPFRRTVNIAAINRDVVRKL